MREIDEQAQLIVEQTVAALAKVDETDETLKVSNSMRLTGLMNNYRYLAEEIIYKELINA